MRFEFEKHLSDCDAVLGLGGDNYSLDYGVPYGFFDAIRATLRRGKPMILWGASIGPFHKQPEFERWATEELKKVSLICARESETVAYLDSIGVRDNVRMVCDPAFMLEPEPAELNSEEQIILQQRCLGLNLSPLLARYWAGEQSWEDQVVQCVKMIAESVDIPLVLIPHVLCPGNNDYAFLRVVVKKLSALRNKIILVGSKHNCSHLKWIISKLGGFMGARTHATIASLSSCVPTVSIGYSVKARGINKDIFGHLDWLIPVEKITPEGLAEAAERLLQNAEATREHLSVVMPEYKQRALQAAGYVREIILDRRA